MIKRILPLGNEIEAQRIKNILEQNNIPHLIRTFHDSAYDGLFQNQYGWGVLEADSADEKKILQSKKNLSGSEQLLFAGFMRQVPETAYHAFISPYYRDMPVFL